MIRVDVTQWSVNQMIDGLNGITRREYGVQVGKGKDRATTDQQYQPQIIERGQVVVTNVGVQSCGSSALPVL